MLLVVEIKKFGKADERRVCHRVQQSLVLPDEQVERLSMLFSKRHKVLGTTAQGR